MPYTGNGKWWIEITEHDAGWVREQCAATGLWEGELLHWVIERANTRPLQLKYLEERMANQQAAIDVSLSELADLQRRHSAIQEPC